MGQTYLAEPDADGDEARTLRPLQAAGELAFVGCRLAYLPLFRFSWRDLRIGVCDHCLEDLQAMSSVPRNRESA